MDSYDFLASAQDCVARFKTSPDEIELRNAVSRSYYWSYHRAVDALRFLDLAIVAGEPSEGMHKQLAKRYIASSYKSLKLIGGLLESAHKQRCLADYKLAEKLSLGFVNQHISKCKSICLKIDQAIDASQKNV